MSKSIYALINQLRFNSKAGSELQRRLSGRVDTGLKGFNGEKILYSLTDEIKEYLEYINKNADSIKKADIMEIVMNDSYASATIEGAKTTIEEVRKASNAQNPNKSEKMVLNTVAGNQYAIENGVSKDNIRTLWEIIVKDVCENESIKGTLYRDGEVYVGREDAVIHF
ncbi:hypothetical protein [Butyrivibrio sp. AE3004]|uniref:hypothetical protein n=1 Tax=Butyrivibrio sp. AE3004 TaxID=1506994 RepID=UPI00049420EC|nr:hypothetical protein [Butyrivibrio sp. AE3004]